jgi:hypothetical protein
MMMKNLMKNAGSALGVRSRKLNNVRKERSLDGLTKIYNLELLRAFEGTLSCWYRLLRSAICNRQHVLHFQGGLTSGRRPIVTESLSQHGEKHVLTPDSDILVG